MSTAKTVRLRVIAYARDRFLEEGIASVSMDDISSGLGISKKTLYKIVPSKEALLELVAHRMMAEARRAIHIIFIADRSFIDKIDQFMVFVGSQLARVERAFAREIRKQAPGLWERIEAFREARIVEAFNTLFAQGVKEGMIRPEISRKLFVLAYVGAINSIVNPRVLIEESLSIHDALHGIITIFFCGILTDEGRRRMEDLEHARFTLQR